MGLIENLQRENLNPIEEAQGLKRLADEFGLTHETIAQAVGKSRSAISNSLRLLSLPEPVQEMLYQRRLEMGHARALLTLPVVEQLELAQRPSKTAGRCAKSNAAAKPPFKTNVSSPKNLPPPTSAA